MSKKVDERVVEMRFDNKQFESATKESMSTLDKLKQKLQFKDAAKGLDNLEKEARKVNLNPLSKAADTITAKFSAMQVAGVTALANITNSAVNAAKNIGKAFTIDPILTGFQEYETQINAIQTILANTESKGSTLQDVNRALAELNTYADKTIYNFTEMTRNIGTFTAAGVDLKTSVSAIKGIANLAAVSGSNSQQASTAMYQLSQALASGTVKLMDWNSVVNAGMGGQVFQDALKETARVHNIAIDDMIKKEGSFRETLQNGWLTAEILTETLSKFTGDLSAEQLKQMGYTEEQIAGIIKMGKTANDAATKVKTFTQLFDTLKEAAQSGWTKSWEIIIGDFGEAKEFLTSISDSLSDVINKFADARNAMLAGGLSSGWKQLLNAGIADEEGYKETLKSVVSEHGTSIDEMIKAEQKLDESLSETEAFQKVLTKGIAEGTLTSDIFTESVHRMAEKMSNMSSEQLEAAGYTKDHVEQIKALSDGLKDGSISMDEFVKKMSRPSGRENLIEALWNSVNGLLSVINPIKEAFREIFPATTGEQLYSLTERIRDFTATLKLSDEQAANLKATFKGIFAILDLIRMVVGGGLNIGFRVLKEVLSAFDMGVLDLTANIGDAIVQFHDWVAEHNLLAKAIQFVIPYVKQAVSAVSEWIKNNETIQNGISKLRSSFEDAIKGVQDWIASIKEADNIPQYILSGLVNGIKSGTGLAVQAIIELGKSILEGIKAVLGIHSPSTEFFEIGKNIILGLINGIKEGISSLLSLIGDIGQKCIDVISKINFGKIFTIAISAGIIYSGKKIYDLAEKFAAPLEGLSKMFSGIGHMFNSVGKILDNFAGMIKVKKYEAIAKMFLNLGIAIGIMAASVWVLSNVPNDKLWNAVKAIGALAVIFGVLAFAMSKLSGASASIGKDGVKISGIKTALISLGVTLLLLAGTVKILSSLTPDQATKGFLGLAGLVAAIGVVLLAFGTFVKGKSAQNIDKFGVMLIKMSGALLLLTKVVKLIGGLSLGEIGKGGLFLAGFLVFISLFSSIAKHGNAKEMKKVSDTLLKISGALLLMAVAIKLIGRLSLGEMIKGAAFMAAFLIFIKMLVKVTTIGNDKQIAQISGLLVAISGSLILLALACKLIGTLSIGDMIKGAAFMAAFLIFIKMLVKVTTIGNDKQIAKVATTILAVSVAIGILAAVSVLLGLVDLAALAKGVAAVTILGGIMTAMIWATKSAENVKGNIIAMTVAIGVMAAAVAALSFINPTKLAGATIAIYMLMGMFAAMMIVAGQAKAAIGPVIAISVVVGLLAGVLYVLSSLPIKSVLESAAALSVLLLAMSVSLAILSAIGPAAQNALLGVLGLLAMIVPLMAFVKVLEAMQNINNAMSNAIILAGFATIMTVLLGVLTGIGIIYMATAGIAATGILGLLAMALPLNAFVDVLAKMQGIQNAEANANILISLMTAMTSLLTQVSILAPLALLGVTAITAMSVVMVALAGLVVAVGALNQTFPQLETFLNSGIDLLARLANGLGQIIGSFVGGVAQGLTSGLPEVATNLSMFMTNLMPFIMGVKLLDESVLTNAQILASLIMTFTKAGLLESIASWFGAGDSLNEFALQLIPFGTAMVAFSNTVMGIDESAVTAAANAGKMMAEMAKTIPREGGWWGKIAGEKDMASFGAKVVAFGMAIKTFSTTLTTGDTINEAAVTSAANAGKQMTELANSMPKSGGIWQKIAGEQDIGVLGAKMVAYASSIKSFSESIKDLNINESAMASAINAGTKMIEFSDLMPKSGGIWQKIAGEKDISDFGAKIVAFGSAIKDFASSISTEGSNIDSAALSVGRLISTLKNIASVNADAIGTFKNALSDLGKTSIDGFINSFTNADAKAKTAITNFLNGISSTVNNGKESVYTDFVTLGSYLVDGFCNGITANTFKAEAQARAMADVAYEAARNELNVNSPSKKFMKVGKSVVEGFAKGIIKNVGTANKASVKMANEVLTSTQDELDINSPSVVFDEKVGRYIVQGIAEGIEKDTSAEEAAEKKAQNIINAFKDAIDRYELSISNREKGYNLWAITEGKYASNAELDKKQWQNLNDDLWDLNQQAKLANDKWRTLAETYGEGSKYAEEAYGDYLDAQYKAAEAAEKLRVLQETNVDREIQTLDDIASHRDEVIKQWEARNKYASTEEQNMFYTAMYETGVVTSDKKVRTYLKGYDELVADIAKEKGISIQEAKQTKEATKYWYENVYPALTEKYEAINKVKDKRDEVFEQEIQNVEDDKSNREELKKRWEATYGRDASDKERYQFEWQMATANIKDSKKIVGIRTKEYVQLIKDIAKEKSLTLEEASQTEQAKEFKNKYLIPAENDALEAENERHDLKMDRLEQEKENRKAEYETASDIADLKYQIWELTTGREAKDEEKETMKLAVLSEQLGNQAKLVDMARNKWKSAKSEDKLKYEKEYWNARLELANLQNDVLDIQESIAKRQERVLDRQRKARDDYDSYLKKYEQYYLDHGMTLEELEKDARLVSGYDPDKVITTAANKTNTAIENVRNNVANLTKAVGEGIQNGISDVTDNTSSMLDACAKTLNKEKDTWFKAGASMVDGLTEGITSKMQTAVDTVTELITKMLAAIQDVATNGMNYTASITPVLDTSSIYNQASKTGNMVSDRQLKIVQAIRQGVDYGRGNSGVNAQTTDPTYTFVQNNYSPKALSSLDIYRQTNNMISRIGKKVNQ